VVAKGNAGHVIVRDDADRRTLIDRLGQTVQTHRWCCFAYCILDNHFHLIVETPEPNLGLGMKWLKASYAQDFNRRHDRQGHLFGGRFHSQLLMTDAHLQSALAYVYVNPVPQASFVVRSWKWCSYAATIGVSPEPRWIANQRVLELYHGNVDTARRLLATAVAERSRMP
jgi:REP element-mobilizing transposase RayT